MPQQHCTEACLCREATIGAAAVREGFSTALKLACEGWPGQGQQRQAGLRAEGILQCS